MLDHTLLSMNPAGILALATSFPNSLESIETALSELEGRRAADVTPLGIQVPGHWITLEYKWN